MDKKKARELVDARLGVLAEQNHDHLSAKVYKNCEAFLNNVRLDGTMHSVLLFTARLQWRETSLFELEKKYTELTFSYVPPQSSAPFPSEKYDLIFVPLYGFNDEGYRLGRGGGWYDKFLATQPKAFKVGVGLELGRIDFQVDPHDIPMDVIITEDRCEILRKRTYR